MISSSSVTELLFTTQPQLLSMISGLPPVLNVMTGVPQARASILTVGKFSSLVGFINKSAAEYISASSLWLLVRRMDMSRFFRF